MFVAKKQALDVREIRRMLWRRRFLIVVPLVVTFAIAAVKVMNTPPTYRSTATLAPETPAPLTRRVAEISGDLGGGRRDRGQDRLLEMQVESSSFMQAVAVQIGLHENPAIRARAEAIARENPGYEVEDLVLRQCVSRLRRMVEVRVQPGGVLSISAVSTSPRLAHVVATAVSEQFLRRTREARLRQSEEAYKFAREQMSIYEDQLDSKRQQLREFEQQRALRPLSSSPVSAANVNRVNTLVSTADADLEFQRGRQEAVHRRIVDAGLEAYLGLDVISSPKLEALRQTVLELEKNLALSLVEYPDDAAPVVATRNQIAVKSQQLLSELEDLAANSLPSLVEEYRQLLVDYEYIGVSIEAAQARKEQLRSFLDKYATDLASMPAEEFRLARLKEEVESATRLYQTWLEQSNATQIAKAVQSGDVGNRMTLLEPAEQPLQPFAPDVKQVLMIAAVMGLALGLIAAVVTEYFDLTLKSVEEIEAVVGAPILGAVPRMQSAVVEQSRNRRRRMWILVTSSVLTALALAAVGYVYFNSQG